MAVELDFGVLPGRIQALAALVDKLDPPASLEIPEDVEAPSFEELESAAEATGSVFEEAMEPAMSVLDAQLQALDEALDGATQLASDIESSVETSTARLQQAADALKNHVDGKCDEVRIFLDAEYDELRSKLEQLHGAAQSLTEAAREFAESFPQKSEEFASRVGNECVTEIEARAREVGEACETALKAISAQLQGSADTLDAELHAQFERVDNAATSGIRNHVEAAGQRVVESALREVASSIAGAVTQMTAGVQLTAMMSPILPQMIVLNKCADALLALIDIYKKSRAGL